MNFANTVLEECESTNDVARQLGEAGYPHGTWISARIQTRGRGRLGREWQSLEGNLFLSVILRVEDKKLWSWIPLMVAVATAKALREMFPRTDVRIKWPNDLWIDRRKLGGILCEAVGNREQSFIVAGLGMNAAVAPEGLDQPAASLGSSADEIRLPVITSILEMVDILKSEGPLRISRHYDEWAALPAGSAIEWGETQSGLVVGLGRSSELIVRTDSGEQKLFAEDVKIRVSRRASDESRP